MPPFMMLGRVLVTEKGGRATSLLVIRRNTAGKVSVRLSTLRWGREMSSQARRLRACLPAASCRGQLWANCRSWSYQYSEPS